MSAPTVFISYSHKDKDLLAPLVAQLKALEHAGLLEVWADTRIDAGDKWYPEIEGAMKRAAVAVCLISEYFLASDFCTKQEIPFLLRRSADEGLLIIPVLLSDCVWQAHPWLKDTQMLPGESQSVRTNFPQNPAAVFVRAAKRIYDKLNDPTYHPPLPGVAWPTLTPDRIDVMRLPETGAALFGREQEIELLNAAWAGAEKTDGERTRILAYTAHGGVGKSTLINHWLAEMKRDNYRGASRVFGWSFYSQGVRGEAAASADAFVAHALTFFGDEAMANSSASPWEKGEHLCRLVGSQRALLVLDGMEPLQSEHVFERGKLRDPALQSLLRGLTLQSPGLCLITTREPLPDLHGRPGVTTRDLEQITPQAGRALLRVARVVATDGELEMLAGRFGPHALAVSLLGVYLREQPGHGIDPAQALEQLPGEKPIDRVLAGMEQWLGKGPEREALRLLGFFDRPVDGECLDALRKAPAIAGLTDHLADLEVSAWDRILSRLEHLLLVHVQRSKKGEVYVDAHPLIREHFAQLLSSGDEWREGHRRIYEYLCATTKEGDKPTLEDLQPLYQAVAHGCQAGMQQKACDEVYVGRILRGMDSDGFYSIKKLGATASDLGAIACFFEPPWSRVSPALVEPAQAWLLNEAATRLRALGRLTEAVNPLQEYVRREFLAQRWANAAAGAANLCELRLALGDVAEALEDAQRSISYADLSEDEFTRTFTRATHGDALYNAGSRTEAEAHFSEAERLQIERQPENPLLYSLAGSRYCDLLLVDAERAAWQSILQRASNWKDDKPESDRRSLLQRCHTVSERAMQTLEWAKESNFSLLTVAHDHLTLGRAALYAAILEPSRSHLDISRFEMDAAVAGVRRSGNMDDLPSTLLTRAWQRSLPAARGGTESAQDDLDEAWEIAGRGPMPLFLTDVHLHRARLFFRDTPYPWNQNPDGTKRGPRDDLAAARRLIEKHGYWRRKEELEDAEKAINKTSTPS